MSYYDKELQNEKKLIKNLAIGSAIFGTIGFLFTRYKTSRSNEWLVKTGLLVENMQIGKKFFQLPFQNLQKIEVTPSKRLVFFYKI